MHEFSAWDGYPSLWSCESPVDRGVNNTTQAERTGKEIIVPYTTAACVRSLPPETSPSSRQKAAAKTVKTNANANDDGRERQYRVTSAVAVASESIKVPDHIAMAMFALNLRSSTETNATQAKSVIAAARIGGTSPRNGPLIRRFDCLESATSGGEYGFCVMDCATGFQPGNGTREKSSTSKPSDSRPPVHAIVTPIVARLCREVRRGQNGTGEGSRPILPLRSL